MNKFKKISHEFDLSAKIEEIKEMAYFKAEMQGIKVNFDYTFKNQTEK